MNLFQAIRDNDLESLRDLLRGNPDLEQQEPDGVETPLTLAVSLQRVEALKLLLEAGADPSYVFPDMGMNLTILQAAASQPNSELVRVLIDAGADLNATNVMGSTALTEALDKGHLKSVDALLNAGADVNAGANGFEKSPALIQAVVHGYFDLIPRLLALRADVNRANTEGATPLMFAIDRGRVLGLFPTDNPFEIMAFVNVRGNEVQLSTDDVVSWFQKFYQDHRFRLMGCLADAVDITLLNPVQDPMKLAWSLYRFCPDMVEQGTDTLGVLAEQLGNSPKIHVWWD